MACNEGWNFSPHYFLQSKHILMDDSQYGVHGHQSDTPGSGVTALACERSGSVMDGSSCSLCPRRR
jgi:hypothetical protein